MLYSEKLKDFQVAHPCQSITVDGARYRYVLAGGEGAQTLVLLNGGMNTLEMWMDYVDELVRDFRVLLFDYPQELRTNQTLVTGMHAFFQKLHIERPVFVGARVDICNYILCTHGKGLRSSVSQHFGALTRCHDRRPGRRLRCSMVDRFCGGRVLR